MDEGKLQADLASQLRLMLLSHFAANGVTPAEIAEKLDVWVSSAQSMLTKPYWAFAFCCKLADAFDLGVDISVVSPQEREVDRVLQELSGAASVELGRLIAQR